MYLYWAFGVHSALLLSGDSAQKDKGESKSYILNEEI